MANGKTADSHRWAGAKPIPIEPDVLSPKTDGPWKLVFKKDADSWKLEEVGAIEEVPQVQDVDGSPNNGE